MKYSKTITTPHSSTRRCKIHKSRHIPPIYRLQKRIWVIRPRKTINYNEGPRIPNRRNNISWKHLLPLTHYIYWRTLWKDKTNTDSKRNHTRRHTQPLPFSNFSRTTFKMVTKRKKWIYIRYIGPSTLQHMQTI